MYTICLQAGHQNIGSNSDRLLAQGTGAPGEAIWTPTIRDRIAPLLVAHGFKVVCVDANVSDHGPHGPFNLTLALHYQSATSSGFGVFVPDPSVDQDSVHSVTLMKSLRTIYAIRTGLPDRSSPRLNHTGEAAHPTWENPNTEFYYLWATQLGPLGLIECGVGALGQPDHALLWNTPAIVAAAIAEGICVAFGVKWLALPVVTKPIPVPVPFPPPVVKPEGPPIVSPPIPLDPPVIVPPWVPPVVSPPVDPPPGLWARFVAWLRRFFGLPTEGGKP